MKFDKGLIPFLRATFQNRPGSDKLLPFTLAKAIAYHLPLPSTKVLSEKQWYIDAVDQDVSGFLCQINERLVIPVAEINKLVYGLWRLRYQMVHDFRALPMDRLYAAVNPTILSAVNMSLLASVDESVVTSLLSGITFSMPEGDHAD